MKNKKTVAIITVFDNLNNGTYLQAFATSYIVEQLGFKVLFINYCRTFNSYLFLTRSRYSNPIKALVFLWRTIRRRKAMQRFVTNKFKTSQLYIGYESLRNNPPIADIYLTGSDQVWNTCHNHGIDKAFYWGEITDDKKKIVSYAASIGLTDFADQDKSQIKKLLDRFSSISVRESSAVEILTRIGIKSTLVLDPTLLLDEQQWLHSIRYSQKYKGKQYILIYSVETTEQDVLIEFVARKIAAKMNLPIWEMCFGKAQKKSYISEYIENPQPEDFLTSIEESAFVIACSFHGTAFSLNFNKPFVSVVPEKYSSRVVSLLKEFELFNHFVNNEESLDVDKILSIDYKKVNVHLNRTRIDSINFLKSALGSDVK